QGTAGSGGSGYVNTSASTKPAGYALTSADYFLTSPKLIGGNSSMPSTSGATETGHQGNGYARITLMD
ncbi:MAG: fimbrillin family protein, partial [Proteobacteria bacterium]|nr:fimbrillin family protein [Pseudomonadota bacterium]